MSDFECAVNYILHNEGGLVENPRDPGGVTNYGISLRFLKSLQPEILRLYGIFEDPTDRAIRDLTLVQAKAIYHGEFWTHAPFEKILNQEHCNFIFDMSVNMGIATTIKCVQRACWAVLKKWDKLPEDGILGENTLKAIDLCGFLIMPALRATRGEYYNAVVKEHPTESEFLDSWRNRTYNV